MRRGRVSPMGMLERLRRQSVCIVADDRVVAAIGHTQFLLDVFIA